MKRKSVYPLFIVLTLTACMTAKTEVTEIKDLTPQDLIRENRLDEARAQFMSPYDINFQDNEMNTVLHLAAQLNDTDLAEFFIKKGADVELKNLKGNTPLHVAIQSGSFETAKLLTNYGADIFSVGAVEIEDFKNAYINEEGKEVIPVIVKYQTALEMGMESPNNSRYEDIFITPETGNRLDDNGQNLVHYFVKRQNIRAVGICIRNKLPLSIIDNEGKTPLDLAFENVKNDTCVNIAALLIQNGADEVETDFSYFQDAVSSRNMDKRFEDNQTPLHFASIFGHTAIAKYLISQNADPNVQDSSGSTPLHEAVRYGNVDIMKMLIECGANVNAQDNLGKSPIMVIMPQDKMETIYSTLAQNNADLNLKDTFGDTLIHTATMMHAPSSVLNLLVENGADVNSKNREGVTPFEIAIQHQDRNMTEFYANHDADIHTKDTHGISPLMLALEADKELFEMTVSRKNVQTQDQEGNTPLHVAILNNAPLEKILYIISLTEDVNIRNSGGNTVLYLASISKNETVVKTLLEKGADIFVSNKDNDSPLRIALRDSEELQDWIINSKTIKSTDGSGNTCLHYAAEWKYKDAIEKLVEKGADPYAKNANGENVLFSAVKTNNVEIIDTVVKCGTPVNERDNLGSTPLHMAVRWDATESIKKLLSMGIDINAQNTSGKSALAESALSTKISTAKVLLDNGADVNSSDTTGCTILMDAIRAQNKKVVKLLLEYNANSSIPDIYGVNAYHEAAKTGDLDIINYIRKAGGNPLSRDKSGNTPFSIVMKGDMKIIKAVLGDSRNTTDSDGNTPIHLVVKGKGSPTLLKELISMGYPVDGRNSDGYTALTYAVENNDAARAEILLEKKANPFQSINKKGANAVSIALEKNNKKIIASIVNHCGKMTDIQGNTILHYAAKDSSADTVKDLLAFGLPKDVKNISGDTPYTIAKRWKRNDIAELLK